MDAREYCRKFEAWAEACMTELPTDHEHTKKWREEFRGHFNFIYVAIMKSDCLRRLIYEGEELRTEQCPIHKGQWSGCYPEPCPEGCDYTGWLPNKKEQL